MSIDICFCNVKVFLILKNAENRKRRFFNRYEVTFISTTQWLDVENAIVVFATVKYTTQPLRWKQTGFIL